MKADIFHTTYNARHLDPTQVAESFIYSDNFEKLIRNNHSVILGARGCGKTTLMKMLTLPALYAWKKGKGKKSLEVRQNISFYAVYISTDIYWDVKNHTYNSQLQKFGTFADVISHFSVNTNVFKSLCETFKNIIEIELKDLDEEKEIKLCKLLVNAWKLPPTIPKLKFVQEALNKRIDEVNQLIHHVIFNIENPKDIPQLEYFTLSFESSVEYLIPLFERIYSLDSNKKKWALCFDELEFAPYWLQAKLFTSLRSRSQFILYKLSASPILTLELQKSLKGDYKPTSGNDFTLIKTWNSKENEKFSKEIISDLVWRKFRKKNAVEFFGTNPVYNKGTDSYTQGSDFYNQIKELLQKDSSFKSFLISKGIDIDNPVAQNKHQKDILFRKIKPVVYFRNFHNELKADSEELEMSRRHLRTSQLFSGIEVLCKICDGNPRWLIGIVTEILLKTNGDHADISLQYRELHNAARRFENVIANIPIGQNNKYTLIEIIGRIGKYFETDVHGSEFKMDPYSTFRVDKNKSTVPDEVIKLLEKAISQGAIILTESDDHEMNFDIRGQRFKLSFLFFLLYKLPLRYYNAVRLSECLGTKTKENHSQPYLFNDFEDGN